MTPLVSVIIPAYNSADTVGATISSALTQSYPHVEVIVVDDGSTDETANIAAAYGERIMLLRQPNGGCASARNLGAQAAQGQLLAFCDADDILLPSCIEAAVRAWRTADDPQACVYMNAYFMRNDGISPFRTVMSSRTPKRADQRRAILEANFTSAHMMIPRSAYDAVGGFNGGLRTVEDWDIWMRLIFSGHLAVDVRKPHLLYRWTSTSLSSDTPQMLADERRIFESLRATAELTNDELKYIERRLSGPSPREMRIHADMAISRGEFTEAAKLFRSAASLSPRDRKLQARRWTVGVVPRLGVLWRRRQSTGGK